MRRQHLIFVAFLLAASTLPARADTLTTNFNVNFTNLTGPEENLFGVSQFNPALGTLNSISATLNGYVDFVPQSPGNSFYQLTLDSPFGNIFRQNYFTSSVISLSANSANVGGYVGINHVILDPDVSVTGGSASSVVSGSSSLPANLTGTFTYNYTPAIAPTPEPSTFVLLGTGLVGIAGALRRRFAVQP